MPLEAGKFRNAILCEDVREELRNKKSLMGVFAGDVLVDKFPAQIRFALYVEYIPLRGRTVTVLIRLLQDEEELGTAEMSVHGTHQPASLILPTVLARFDQP